MEVELVPLGALDHPEAVVAWIREHAALLPFNLSQDDYIQYYNHRHVMFLRQSFSPWETITQIKTEQRLKPDSDVSQ